MTTSASPACATRNIAATTAAACFPLAMKAGKWDVPVTIIACLPLEVLPGGVPLQAAT